ncbi:MAG TPA: hypothetical protein VG370_01015 [Chloroflexota bacterium]|nr:hypothetical protein [Chloroflexota bacterium]
MTRAPEPLAPASRVRFGPFAVRRRNGRALIGWADGSEWLEVDALGAEVVERLDRGLTIDEVQTQVARETGQPVDVLIFARELQALGLVASVDGEAGSQRLEPPTSQPERGWAWGLFALCSSAAIGYVAWAFASGALPVPGGADLLVPGLPLPVALLVWGGATVGVLIVHEAAHVVVGRACRLRTRVRLRRRAVWLVAETDLTGVWGLERPRRWRPIAAGLMADGTLLAAAVLFLQIAPEGGVPAALVRMVAGVLVAHVLWQCQWYLRTDLYYMMCVVVDAFTLRRTAWLLARRLVGRAPADAAEELAATPAGEVRAAKVYLLSLIPAAAASVALWWWVLLPVAAQLWRAVAGGAA